MSKLSRTKGRAFEQEAARKLRPLFGDRVKRGYQRRDGGEAPDVETWIDIPGAPNYQVSSLGRLRSFVSKGPGARRRDDPHLINPTKNSRGYLHAKLRMNGVQKHVRIHRIVLLAFVGEPAPGQVACHCDGDQLNNALSNLRWDTPAGNMQDQFRHGTRGVGEESPNVTLTNSQAEEILRLSSAISKAELARRFGVNWRTVDKLVRGLTWSWLREAAHVDA